MWGVTVWAVRALALAVAFAASAPNAPLDQRAGDAGRSPALAQETPPAKCCFTHSAYTGTCEVEPAKDESCGQILDYLNNPMSQGKSYCGNTTIRGGWQSVACESEK